MEEIINNSKSIEHKLILHDPLYDSQVASIYIVKQFIRERGLILYGGTAIDYALRLHGSCIYPDSMLAVPDLDFFSPRHVEDSYDLVDILGSNGYPDARAINALHIETQRVDIKNNHWVADISYRPQKIFESLPTITYEGMKCIHPDYQRVDLHSSLCFPYDNPPIEVIFNRWNKDIQRFNLLDKYYPITASGNIETTPISFPTLFTHKCLINGIAAYAAICTHLRLNNMLPHGVVDLNMSIDNDTITFDGLSDVELLSHNFESATKYLSLSGVKEYHPYINLLPDMLTGYHKDIPVSMYSSEHRLVSYKSVVIGGKKIRIVCVQYILMHLLSKYLVTSINAYKILYVNLLQIVKTVNDPLLGLSVEVFGSENASLSKRIAIASLDHEILGTPMVKRSVGYRYGKERPNFDINDMIYKYMSGELKE